MSRILVSFVLVKQPGLSLYSDLDLQHRRGGGGGYGSGFIPIAEYGAEFRGGWGKGNNKKNVVRLLYSGRNHYDLLR